MYSHKARNLKTAVMFGICLSFLIFAGSTFELLGELIVSQLETAVGSDLYGVVINPRGLPSFIDEGKISEFLKEQKEFDGAVLGWTMASPSLKYLLGKLNNGASVNTRFSDSTGYKSVNSNIYAVQSGFLDAVN